MKKILCILLSCAFLLFTACGDHNQIYDNEKKIAGKDSYSASFSGSSADGVYSAYGKISGAITVWRHEIEAPFTLDIVSTLSVTSGGKASLVLITPSGETMAINIIENELPHESTNNPAYLLEESGLYRIKLVATDDAEFAFSLDVPVGEYGPAVN